MLLKLKYILCLVCPKDLSNEQLIDHCWNSAYQLVALGNWKVMLILGNVVLRGVILCPYQKIYNSESWMPRWKNDKNCWISSHTYVKMSDQILEFVRSKFAIFWQWVKVIVSTDLLHHKPLLFHFCTFCAQHVSVMCQSCVSQVSVMCQSGVSHVSVRCQPCVSHVSAMYHSGVSHVILV